MTSSRILLLAILVTFSLFFVGCVFSPLQVVAVSPESELRAYPLFRVFPTVEPQAASGYSPAQIRTAYNLPSTGGTGTIAIIDAYNTSTVRNDLTFFSSYFGLPAADLEIYNMSSRISVDNSTGWALETALDVEWAHAIAPNAKILLVQAKSDHLSDLFLAVDYAANRSDVVSISMSWGTDEFAAETYYDFHFASFYGATFFASSGDDGAGVIWPASSPNVVAVGGTTLNLNPDGTVISETGWSGSGGGTSAYEPMPLYQAIYGLAGNRRAVPDVSYDAKPSTGFPVYSSFSGSGTWSKIGGTSAGAPQWAAIQALGLSASNNNFYQDAKSSAYASYFRDITSGSNGAYTASVDYDYVTGLGSPLTTNYTPSVTTTTVITLLPAGQSTPLSATNQFTVTYTLNGAVQTAFAQDDTLTLSTDQSTNVILSGTSTASTASEKWVFNSSANPVSTASGSSLTLYYYHLLTQTTTYTVMGGGNPSNPAASYLTAPATASGTASQTPASAQLSQSSHQTIWPIKGSTVSITNPITRGQSERWSTQTSAWAITGINQVPSSITYYHQYLATIGYQITGGGSPTPPTFTATSLGVTSASSMPLNPASNWLDSGSTYTFSNPLSSSTPSERWSTTALTNGAINGPITISPTFYHQFQISLAYAVLSGGTPNAPTFAYSSYGNPASAQLTSSQQLLWADSNSLYSAPSQLNGSTPSERWSSLINSGTVQTSTALIFTYYHQFNVSVAYSLIGDGNPTTPTLSSTAFGNLTSIQLAISPQSFWIDSGSQYSAPSLLTGSTETERWYSSTNSGTIQGPTALNFTYIHQFLLNVTGALASSQWYNSSDMAQVSVPGVYGRTSGMGQRVNSYSVDRAASTPVQPSTETVTISIVMDAAHQLQINSAKQYQVTLDASAARALASITAPTISGDNYWYDEGTPAVLFLNGVGSRLAGSGEKLASYSVNGVLTSVSTANQVEVLNIGSLLSPQTVSAAFTVQYQLSTPSGSLRLITAPSIAGDAGWYDAGTAVTITYDYSWNPMLDQSRLNAVGYAVNQGATTPLIRSGSGTFQVQVTMTEPKSVAILSTAQYSFTVVGGYNIMLSQASPTGDSFFDSGTALTVTSDQVWNLVNGTARQNLFSYTLNGVTASITRADAGNLTTPTITFNSAHELTFNLVTQYMASFQFKDNTGTDTITPASFQIKTDDSVVVDVPQFTVWLDSGTQFQIHSVMWQNADVKPADQTNYTANEPLNETILCRIFNAQLAIQDYLGVPISGAQLAVTLANQTTINVVSGSDGTVNLPMIPIGTFNATITYLGATTAVVGDASVQTVTTETISPSPSSPLSPSFFSSPSSSPSPKPTASPTAPVVPEMPSLAAIIALTVATFIVALAVKKKISLRYHSHFRFDC